MFNINVIKRFRYIYPPITVFVPENETVSASGSCVLTFLFLINIFLFTIVFLFFLNATDDVCPRFGISINVILMGMSSRLSITLRGRKSNIC